MVLKGQHWTAVDQRFETKRWMDVLLPRANEAGAEGEVPVAAVILDGQGRAIGHGRNRRQNDRDPLGHAELVALQQAAIVQNDWRFNSCTLIVTLEPCPMCAGAIVNSRIPKVVYGAKDPKAGAVDSLFSLLNDERLNHRCEVVSGILEDQTSELLKKFFKKLREKTV